RPTLARLADAGGDLLPAERLHGAGPLDDDEAGGLQRGEATTALGTLTTPSDRGAILCRAGLDDPGVGMSAVRTVHAASSPRAVTTVSPERLRTLDVSDHTTVTTRCRKSRR